MNSEKLIIQIIKNTGLSRGEIIEMTERKKKNLKENPSDTFALFLTAKELAIGSDISNNRCLDDWIYSRVNKS